MAPPLFHSLLAGILCFVNSPVQTCYPSLLIDASNCVFSGPFFFVKQFSMALSSFKMTAFLVSSFLTLVAGQTTTNSADGLSASAATIETTTIEGTPTTFRPIFTVPTSADVGANILPNIQDPQAVDAQKVCPGYTALNVQKNAYGLSAVLTLAGKACNVYGTDIDTLNLTVQYQSTDRLSINISPARIVSELNQECFHNIFSRLWM